MRTREQMMNAFLSNSGGPKFGKLSATAPVGDAVDCSSAERSATWIPQRRDSVPVEALQRAWRGRRRDDLSE